MAQGNKRGRNQRRRSGPNINRAMDSTGPEVKIRGTANQIYDKYLTLARDAASSGDRIRAESLMQHAEHYFRVMKAMQPPQQQQQQAQQADPADEPQPELAGAEEKVSGEAKSEDKPDAEKPARGRRPRRSPESEAKSEEAAADSADEEESEKPKRTRKRRAPRKSVSEETGAEEASGEVAVAE